MKKTLIIVISSIIFILILLILFPNLNSIYKKQGKLYISEILASNSSVLEDNEGDFSDYIEIYNGYNTKINLNNYHLSDSEYETGKWAFPNITINPKEYLIIYASGKDTCDIENKICHTNFKLSSKGEVITLTDQIGNIISKFEYPEQFTDISFGYKDGKYIYFETPTPGEENNSEEYSIKKTDNYKLEITEYMTHNKRSNYDKYGNYFDWIEIYNSSNKDYSLENLYISDNSNKLRKYKIKSTTLKSKDYLVIYFSGENKNYEEGLYVPFKLSDDEEIIISNGIDVIDKVKIIQLSDNISYGKVNGEWKYFAQATPGRANTTASFDKIGGLNGSS